MHTIFLVHGMGASAPGWSDSIQTAIKKYYDPSRYAFLRGLPFDEHFAFAKINPEQCESTSHAPRIVQNLSRNRSRGCAMMVAQHSTKSLAPFDCTVTFLDVSGGL